MKKQSTFLCLVMVYPFFSFGQSIGPSTLNATGRSTTVNGMTFEEAIGGFIAGSTFESSGLIVTPGVLQPKTATPNSINDPKLLTEITVFPNPAAQQIFIQPGFSSRQLLSCTITDNLGRVMIEKTLTLDKGNERQEINLSSLSAGPYYLNLSWSQSNGNYTRGFKIQKTK